MWCSTPTGNLVDAQAVEVAVGRQVQLVLLCGSVVEGVPGRQLWNLKWCLLLLLLPLLLQLAVAAPPAAAPGAPPAPAGPSLANLPVTVPNVVDNDPNPLTCPVCLDSKAQVICQTDKQ